MIFLFVRAEQRWRPSRTALVPPGGHSANEALYDGRAQRARLHPASASAVTLLEPTNPLGPASRPPSIFAKLFQRSVVPMPSFSKECLGDFVGFQRVTIDPNPKCRPPNFLARMGREESALAQGPSDSVEQHGKTVAPILFFRKTNRAISALDLRELFDRFASGVDHRM
jgi:hypothetical protein